MSSGIPGTGLPRKQYTSREGQRRDYLQGEYGNPFTTTPTGGRILSALQLPLFLIMPPRGFGVLTTTGRKTGRKRRKCVRAIRDGDKVFLVSLRGRFGAWFRNLEAHPDVEIRIKGGRFKGLAREVTDSAEQEQARRAFCETVNFFDRLEHRAHRRGRPTPDSIRALHARWFSVGTPVVIEVEPNATRGTIQS